MSSQNMKTNFPCQLQSVCHTIILNLAHALATLVINGFYFYPHFRCITNNFRLAATFSSIFGRISLI